MLMAVYVEPQKKYTHANETRIEAAEAAVIVWPVDAPEFCVVFDIGLYILAGSEAPEFNRLREW
jgi:hypothetical protein